MPNSDKLTKHLSGLEGCFVAGGAITSLYTNAPINDLDIYAKTPEDLENAIHWAFDCGLWCADASSRAMTFKGKGEDAPDIQIMHFDTFKTARKIFGAFDFTVCMGAFDLDTKKFVLDPRFLEHCSQRFLSFNRATRFPYASAWRVRKYEDRGYTIGKIEFQKILMACAERPIMSWDDLREQLGGVYGEAITIPDDTEFSQEAAWRAMDTLTFVKKLEGYANAEEAIACVSNREIPYFIVEADGSQTIYAQIFEDTWDQIGALPKRGRKVGMDTIYPTLTFWKKVRRETETTFRSIHQSHFTYTLGGEASSPAPFIYAYSDRKRAEAHYASYGDQSKYAILELKADPADIIHGTEIRLRRCAVVAAHGVGEEAKIAA